MMISVKERLPNSMGSVIVLLDCCGKGIAPLFDIGYFKPKYDENENEIGGTWLSRIPKQNGDNSETIPLEEIHGAKVTHWAPLPRPPESYLRNLAKKAAEDHAMSLGKGTEELFHSFYNNELMNWAMTT